MRHKNTVLHEVLKGLPRGVFDRAVSASGSDRRVRRLSSWDHLVAMVTAQLVGVRSLRELEAVQQAHAARLYHVGARPVRRATVSDANARRAQEPFEAVFRALVAEVRLGRKERREAETVVRLLDSTLIKLGAGQAPWAACWTRGFAAAKLHLVYDPVDALPVDARVTPGRINDSVAGWDFALEPGATYVFDRGYYSFAFWAALDAAGCRFVTRLNTRSPSHLVEERTPAGDGVLADRVVHLNARLGKSRRNPCHIPLREVVVRRDDGRRLRLVSNDLSAPAAAIAALYKQRWQIELFFKWIKQTLKVRAPLGHTLNAVKIQLLCALIAYLLVRRLKHQTGLDATLQRITRLIGLNMMQRRSVQSLLSPDRNTPPTFPDQLSMALQP